MAASVAPEIIRPQPGPQAKFLGCRSDIALIGGSVFGGKTWALTYQPLTHVHVPGFTCVTFRRTRPDIRNPGSLWDESLKWYPDFGATPREQALEWDFPSGARVKMDGLQHEQDVLSWKSAQVALLQFDQLEEFTEYQFWYMQSRNRTQVGPGAYTRASCNAMADTWVADLIHWWWDAETGYAIRDRSGLARWFVRVNDKVEWSNIACVADAPMGVWTRAVTEAKADLERRFPGHGKWARSFAFIRASLADNKIGVELDPEYEARVRTLSQVEQERLLGGNWKIRPAAGQVFNRTWFELVEAIPALVVKRVRYWDKAGTASTERGAPHASHTVGVRMATMNNGQTLVEDVIRGQWAAGDRERVIKDTARADATIDAKTITAVEQEPGSGGKDAARYTIMNLAGYPVFADRPTGDLTERCQPLAAQAQVGNVKLVRAHWNADYLHELHAFPTEGVADDQVSASSGAFKFLRFGTVAPSARYTIIGPHA